MVKITLIVLAIIIAAMRIGGFVSPAFQAAAHLYVGFLIGLAFRRGWWPICVGLAIALTVVEVLVFTGVL